MAHTMLVLFHVGYKCSYIQCTHRFTTCVRAIFGSFISSWCGLIPGFSALRILGMRVLLVHGNVHCTFIVCVQDAGTPNMSELVSAVASKMTSAVLGKLSRAG